MFKKFEKKNSRQLSPLELEGGYKEVTIYSKKKKRNIRLFES